MDDEAKQIMVDYVKSTATAVIKLARSHAETYTADKDASDAKVIKDFLDSFEKYATSEALLGWAAENSSEVL